MPSPPDRCPAQPSPLPLHRYPAKLRGSWFESAHRRPFFIETELDFAAFITRPAKVSIPPYANRAQKSENKCGQSRDW